jgi:Mg-chelatase subunit ChlD
VAFHDGADSDEENRAGGDDEDRENERPAGVAASSTLKRASSRSALVRSVADLEADGHERGSGSARTSLRSAGAATAAPLVAAKPGAWLNEALKQNVVPQRKSKLSVGAADASAPPAADWRSKFAKMMP